MTEKRVTSPAEYEGIVEKAQSDPGELVTLDSGMVVLARRADMEGMVMIGQLPQSLLTAYMDARGDLEAIQEAIEDQDKGEMMKHLIFIRETVRGNVIAPRIVYDEQGIVSFEWPKGERKKVLPSDFLQLFNWITGLEGYSDGLESFRNRKGRRAAASGSRRKKLQQVPQSVPGDNVPA